MASGLVGGAALIAISAAEEMAGVVLNVSCVSIQLGAVSTAGTAAGVGTAGVARA